MSAILDEIRRLVGLGNVVISQHARIEIEQDNISIDELIAGLQSCKLVEEYPDYAKGPCVLVFQLDSTHSPVHALWGIRKGTTQPAVLVTAYRPDPLKWTDDLMRRKS